MIEHEYNNKAQYFQFLWNIDSIYLSFSYSLDGSTQWKDHSYSLILDRH